MDKVGSSISNRYTSRERDIDLKRIMEDWSARTSHGKVPGTHTLGVEYATPNTKKNS